MQANCPVKFGFTRGCGVKEGKKCHLDSAVHLHLKDKGHSFEDGNVNILAREERWFERGEKEAIFIHLEKPSLNRGGGLRHFTGQVACIVSS